MPTALPATASPGASGSPTLLATKLHVPSPPPPELVVPRPRILERLFYADERFVRVIRRDWWLALAVGIVTLLGILTTLALGDAETLMDTPSAPGFYLFWVFAVIDAWCWSLFMLSIGMRYLDFSNKWLQYGQEAIVPFYVFHQPVIMAIAFYAVQWETGILPKMLAVILGSFVVTSAIYVLLVRRVAPLRDAFGMKAAVQLPAALPQEATPVSPPGTLPSA